MSAPAADTPSMKRALRRELLATRRTADHHDHDQVVRATVRAFMISRRVRSVAAYVPMPGEPGGPELPESLAEVIPRVLLPVVLPDRDLEWSAWNGPDELVPAGLGLREPTGPRLGRAAVQEADVLLVPALAVDERGARLGRGGGSFDRVLTARRPRLVLALLYPGELIGSLPVEAHDRPVDGVVIDGAVTVFSSR